MRALDRLDLIELEDRDAETLDAERADQHDDPERLYIPTTARRTLHDENDTAPARGLIIGLSASAAMWIAALTIAIDLGAFR